MGEWNDARDKIHEAALAYGNEEDEEQQAVLDAAIDAYASLMRRAERNKLSERIDVIQEHTEGIESESIKLLWAWVSAELYRD